MNCKNYLSLSEIEQREFDTKVLHAIKSTNWGFDSGKEIIEAAEMGGYFVGIKIGHDDVYGENFDVVDYSKKETYDL